MSKQEILEKAISKAIEGGWNGFLNTIPDGNTFYYPSGKDLLKWRWEEEGKAFSDGEYDDYESINVEAVIFNHDFAKALWPGKWRDSTERGQAYPYWQTHLQRMVISDDPIAYLGENL